MRLPEGLSKPTELRETRRRYTGIRFEPGIHAEPGEKPVERGDLTKHTWNKQVAERLREYHPIFLAIDGLSPSHIDFYNPNIGLRQIEKEWIWDGLPARPKDINPQESEINVIRGDLDFFTLIDHAVLANSPDFDREVRQLNRVKEEMLREENRYEDKSSETQRNLVLIESPLRAGVLTVGYILFDRSISAKRRSKKAQNDATNRPKISRRGLLRGAATFVIGATAVSPFVSTIAGPYADSERGRNFWQELATLSRPRIWQDEWVDARTALLIAKQEDALALLGYPKDTSAAIVMGNAHMWKAEILLHDEDVRRETIAGFVACVVDDLDRILNDYPEVPRDIARNNMLDNIAKADVVSIVDPGGIFVIPSPPTVIDAMIQPVASFQSPQVEEAIDQFR